MKRPCDSCEQNPWGEPLRHDDAEQSSELDLLEELGGMRDLIRVLKYDVQSLEFDYRYLESRIQSLKSDSQNLRSDFQSNLQSLRSRLERLEISHQKYLFDRNRAISLWVRHGFGKDGKDIVLSRPNGANVYGDVRHDAMIVSHGYNRRSCPWQAFRIVYGINPEDVEYLDQAKCWTSLRALNRAAYILLDKARKSLPDEMAKKREDIVALLLARRYEEANEISDAFLRESVVAEEESEFC